MAGCNEEESEVRLLDDDTSEGERDGRHCRGQRPHLLRGGVHVSPSHSSRSAEVVIARLVEARLLPRRVLLLWGGHACATQVGVSAVEM